MAVGAAARAAALALAASLLAGCAGTRVDTGPAALAAPPAGAALWAGPLDANRAAALFDALCLAFAPQFESVSAMVAAGFDRPAAAPTPGGPVFRARRADGALASLTRTPGGGDAPTRTCAVILPAQPAVAADAARQALGPKLRARFPAAESTASRVGWRLEDKESGLELTVIVAKRGPGAALTATAVE